MLPIIDPEEDYLTIVAAEEKIAATESRRKKEIEESQGNLKGELFSYTREAAGGSPNIIQAPCIRPFGTGTCEDKTKLDLMKSISDMESLVASQEAELTKLKDEARQLEEYDPALEHKKELGGSALRLRMYEKLGFEPVFDKKGALVKILVRSTKLLFVFYDQILNPTTGAQSGDLHVVPMDGQKSDFAQSRLLWKLASS
ncbi:hypothetical protein C0995_007905 [Termitomyces sp. Mi166|nr:hypothetical protein C0995_007905 [Termitomyces sp. Mi166\